MRVLILLALIGCGSDQGFHRPDPPNYPPGLAPPIESISQTDHVVQVQIPQVDILWIIDNSCSMVEEQTSLTENFPIFMDYFLGSGLDYHIGVTSTDIDNTYNGSKGKLVVIGQEKHIDVSTLSPVELFTQMATLGTSGSGAEKGMGATYQALEIQRDQINAGFYRDEAAIHTIVISDEPDSTPASVITQAEFIDWYDNLKDDVDERSFSSIIDSDGGTYRNITNQIGGIIWDITTDDWATVLDQLRIQAAGLKKEYFLSNLPIVDTIEVSVDDITGAHLDFLNSEWSYAPERNSITFLTYIPNPLAVVNIEYDLLSAESFE